MKKHIMSALMLSLYVSACAVSPQKFDSQKWKFGDKSIRGSMVEDLKNNKILYGKNKTQVEELLGEPDESGKDYSGYAVNTISRCHLWKCIMEIKFNSQTGKTRGDIAVSD